MIADATDGQIYRFAWWMLLFPGLMLVFTTLAFNLVGDALRDALDPRSNR
jgi:peptide/nickel transport system permease protein